MRIMFDAGHTEYMPRGFDDSMIVNQWSMYDEEDEGRLPHEGLNTADVVAAFTERMGREPAPDWYIEWGTIYEVDVTLDQLRAWVDDMIGQISAVPSGDDSVYDYWPSGCRLLMQLAHALDAAEVERIEETHPTIVDLYRDRNVNRAARVIRSTRVEVIGDGDDTGDWDDNFLGIA